ncbi:hypothetical protein [Streptomyces sp. T028]|uniref:hypothetical protein n=1 Tax=Streptomyces sp. T028 TaxID=3394379 RepID=UPI003A852442
MRFISPSALLSTSVVAALGPALLLTAVAQHAEPAKGLSTGVLAGDVVLDQPLTYDLDEWNSKG